MRRLPPLDERLAPGIDALPRRGDGTVDWEVVFGTARPLRVEIGSGNSPFLLDVARLEPEYNYLGTEYADKRIRKLGAKLAHSGLANVRLLRVNAERVFRDLLRPGELDHVFLNFPDPWPKRRQARRRFVQRDRVERVLRVLRPGGGLSLKTDAAHYAAQMLEVLESFPELENLAGPGAWTERPRFPFPTPFELEFAAEARPIWRLEYSKRPAGHGVRSVANPLPTP